MKTLSIMIIAVLVTLLLVSCAKSSSSYNPGGRNNNGGNGGGASSDSVSIIYFGFNSSNITVNKGATVTWKNNDLVTHTVTSDDGSSFDSGSLPPRSSFTHTFNTTGTFTYHCSIHAGMTAKVVVQ